MRKYSTRDRQKNRRGLIRFLMLSRELSEAARTRRQRLAAGVEHILIAIADGDVLPETIELDALAQLCDDAQLPTQAARLRQVVIASRSTP